MYLVCYLVELLLLISVSAQESVTDEPDPNMTIDTLQQNTTDKNEENPSTEQIEPMLPPTESPDKLAEASEDFEITSTLAPLETPLHSTTQVVGKRSGRTEMTTESEARSHKDETRSDKDEARSDKDVAISDKNTAISSKDEAVSIKDEARSGKEEGRSGKDELQSTVNEDIVASPTTVSDLSEASPEFLDRASLNQDEIATDSYEDHTSRISSPTESSHMNPNTIIDVKSRSGIVEDIHVNENMYRRFDLGNQTISSLRNNPTIVPVLSNTEPMNKHMDGGIHSNPGQIKSYDIGLLNELLPFYTGKPMDKYSNAQANTYTMDKSLMNLRNVHNKNVMVNGGSEERNIGINARPIYQSNFHRQRPSYGNDLGYFKPANTEIAHNYNRPIPLQKRIPVQTMPRAEVYSEVPNRYRTERPSVQISRNLGYRAPEFIHENFQNKPADDIYRKLIMDKFAQNYRPLGYQVPEFSSGQRPDGIEGKIHPYYPKTTIIQENHLSTPPYFQIPVLNYGDGHRSPG